MTVSGRKPPSKGNFVRIANGEAVSRFDFQFNPEKVTRGYNADYEFVSSPGSVLPSAQFLKIGDQAVTLQLLFDAVETYRELEEGVSFQLAEIESYAQPDLDRFSADLGSFVAPPEVRYSYGFQSTRVVIPRISVVEERWNRSGVPTRARVDIEMRLTFSSIAAVQAHFDRLASLRLLAVRT